MITPSGASKRTSKDGEHSQNVSEEKRPGHVLGAWNRTSAATPGGARDRLLGVLGGVSRWARCGALEYIPHLSYGRANLCGCSSRLENAVRAADV
jgi:hypothetical protein